MSVLKRGDSQYWYIQFQFNGKTYIRSSKTTDKKAANQMERDWRQQLHAQQCLGQKERITIGDAVAQFCESKQGSPNHRNLIINQNTLTRLFRTQRHFDEVTSHDLERLKQSRIKEGSAPSTINHTFNLLRGSWQYAKRMGYQVSELDYPKIKIPKSRLRYLSKDEEKRLLIELNPYRETSGLTEFKRRSSRMKQAMVDNYDVVILLLDTGARYSEIANLNWDAINLNDRTINLWRSKVQNESIIYMTDRVHGILTKRSLTKQSRHLFTNQQGRSRGYCAASIRKALRRAGLHDCTIHTFRHTHASRLIQNGMNIYEVKAILGHADIKTTLRYAHLEQRNVSSKARDVINTLNKQTEKPDLRLVAI